MSDHRNELARERDAYLDSWEGALALDASTLGRIDPDKYLRNRIERAFLAGWHARENAKGDQA